MDDSALRQKFGEVSAEEWRALAVEHELDYWRSTARFCGRCGAEMAPHPDPRERAMKCPKCGYLVYPRITPAVIALVRKGDRILLQRNTHYRLPHWSLVAGFIEPAETFEQAVAREAMEEAGIEVENIRYFASQMWPFPSNIMVGFTADWKGGELRPDGEEVVESGWFAADALPSIPGKVSIARRLIDAWLEGRI